jgi:hypothetical protein
MRRASSASAPSSARLSTFGRLPATMLRILRWRAPFHPISIDIHRKKVAVVLPPVPRSHLKDRIRCDFVGEDMRKVRYP